MHFLEAKLLELAHELQKTNEALGEELETIASISHYYYLPKKGMDEEQVFQMRGIKLNRKN